MSKTAQKPAQVNPEAEAQRKKTQKKIITYIAVVLVLGACIGGFFGYRAAQSGKASKAMFTAEEMFADGDFNTVIKGDSTGKSMSMPSRVSTKRPKSTWKSSTHRATRW